MKRRDFNTLVSAMGLGMFTGSLPGISKNQKPLNSSVKRVVFFLQNHGFEPLTCLEKSLTINSSLDSLKLAPHMEALEPYKEKMNVVMGLHGRHTSPTHSACFGALGGYRGGMGVPPSAATIDHVISELLPQSAVPHLCIGMDSLESMQGRPTAATLSASGPSQPKFMYSHPEHLYQMLFGSVSEGELNKRYNIRTKLLVDIENEAKENEAGLSGNSKLLFSNYVNGLRSLNGLHEKLRSVSGTLKKFKPKLDERYSNPKFETDWHDCLLEIGIAALQADLTNVLTIGSGRGEIMGAWKGLGVAMSGHNLGHMKQHTEDTWLKIRRYNCQMLVKLIKSLEAIPEGGGSMMDNTLIVYTSNNGASQHTSGVNWPFVLIGNGGGVFKTGQALNINNRPLNDLYSTFLYGMGAPAQRFNLSEKLASKFNSKTEPLKELLA